MTMIAFDTLKLARKLEAGGFSAKQAESAAEAFADVVQDTASADHVAEIRAEMVTRKDLERFATKNDLETAVAGIRAEMATKKDLENAVAGIRAEMATKKDLENAVAGVRAEMATKKDLQDFATKADLQDFATKADLQDFATKADLQNFATKADLQDFATKKDLQDFATKKDLQLSLEQLKSETLRWMFTAVAAQAALIVAFLKLLP